MVELTILGYWHCCQHYSTFVRCLCDVRCKWMRTTNFTKRSNYMMMTIKYKLSKWCLKHKTPRRANNLSRMMPSTSRCQMGVKYVPWWVFSQSVGPHSSVTFYFTCSHPKCCVFVVVNTNTSIIDHNTSNAKCTFSRLFLKRQTCGENNELSHIRKWKYTIYPFKITFDHIYDDNIA